MSRRVGGEAGSNTTSVILSDANDRDPSETARRVIQTTGDVTKFADLGAMREEIERSLGPVDILVTNAGGSLTRPGPLETLPEDGWNASVNVNLTATFLTARAFLRGLTDTGRGALVLVGSTAGRFGEAGHADYAAAKAAIQGGLLLSLKNEAARLGPGVRVNAVAPGWTASPMTRGLLEPDDVERITRTMPLRKVATPADVAAQVVVLASERLSGHVTGELVTVAGGMEGRILHAD